MWRTSRSTWPAGGMRVVVGELAAVAAGVGAAVLPAGERRDLLQRQAGALGDVDDRQAVQHLLAVAALAGHALSLWEDADAFIEPDVRRAEPCALGDLADGQERFVLGGGHDGVPLT